MEVLLKLLKWWKQKRFDEAPYQTLNPLWIHAHPKVRIDFAQQLRLQHRNIIQAFG